jgi:hypothetical protein
MKSSRDMMIDEIVESVEYWDWLKLVGFVKDALAEKYSVYSAHEIKEVYAQIFGEKDEKS